MDKYLKALKEKKYNNSEINENSIFQEGQQEVFGDKHTLTHPQKVQKVESPDVATGHRWRDLSVCPVELLDELIASGATLVEKDGVLRVSGEDIFDERTRDAVRDQKTALLVLWRFRQYAATRIRFVHWVCPDAQLLALWRQAETACQMRLTISGARAKIEKKL